jgi:predicted PurR-regulated permease PerM
MNFLIVIAVGIYFAIEPGLYRRGFIKLLPLGDRRRAHEVLDATGNTLWWWIIGVLISMATIGVLTTIGLWALGIPLAPTLGLLTGILAFIPNFGPILSAIPPMLLGLMISPMDAVYVGLLYIGVQAIESNIVTPQVQKRTVSMPPVLGMIGQLLFGIFFGFLGLLLATPLVAAIIVMVKMLYVEDVLGDKEDETKAVTPSAHGAATASLVEKGPSGK